MATGDSMREAHFSTEPAMNAPVRPFFMVLVAVACASCATPDFGEPTDKLLNVAFIKEQFGASEYPDVTSGGQCPGAQGVSVKLLEDRSGLHVLSSFPKVVAKHQEIAVSVQRYFESALREAKLSVLPTGGTLIQVRVEELTMTTGWGPAAGSATLAVSVPQWNHSAKYLGEAVSGTVPRGIAYSIHKSVLAFLRDPEALKHLQCKAAT